MEEKNRALLVGVNIDNQKDFQQSMEELGNLAIACDFEVVGKIQQNLKAINKAYYIGTGKVEEVLIQMNETKAEVLIFNNELSPSQLRNIEERLECTILDRTSLILEIFHRRAKTKEAKLQVEVARLQYMLPRLIGINESLGRQGGGSGLKNRGAGETKLELDRRKIEIKIAELDKELQRIGNERQTQRKKRNKIDLPSVALVGYTNAGKSSIMNAMVEMFKKSEAKKVFEKNMLFATLETSVRNITLPDNKAFLLSDTVGFVSNLPHNLVKAFRTTLEEVREADLLIHVVDLSNPDYKQQIEVTSETLKQIGAENIPMIYAYNKIDLVDFDIPAVHNDCVSISAKNKAGIDQLINLISQQIFTQYVQCRMLIPYESGSIVSYFKDNANVQSMSYEGNGIVLTLECKEADYQKYQQFLLEDISHGK